MAPCVSLAGAPTFEQIRFFPLAPASGRPYSAVGRQSDPRYPARLPIGVRLENNATERSALDSLSLPPPSWEMVQALAHPVSRGRKAECPLTPWASRQLRLFSTVAREYSSGQRFPSGESSHLRHNLH